MLFPRHTLVSLLACAALASSAFGDPGCIKINAKGAGSITAQTLTETDTESQIIGGGIIHGTTTAQLFATGFNPDAGEETFVGTLVLTTMQGTLILYLVDGVFDTITGEFSNDSVVIDGTGRFAGATGGLYFHGFVAADGTFIDDEISGQLCLDG